VIWKLILLLSLPRGHVDYSMMDFQGPFEPPIAVSGHDRLDQHARNRRVNDHAIIENPLSMSSAGRRTHTARRLSA